jgi:hypothetical protein
LLMILILVGPIQVDIRELNHPKWNTSTL